MRTEEREKDETKATFCPEYDATRLPPNLFSFQVLAMIRSGFVLPRSSSEHDFEVSDKRNKKQKRGRSPHFDGLELHCLKCEKRSVRASSPGFIHLILIGPGEMRRRWRGGEVGGTKDRN